MASKILAMLGVSDLSEAKKKVNVPIYNYSDQIVAPADMGMSTDANSIGPDVSGILAYINALGPSDKTEATRTGGPIGNKYFLSTGTKCSATNTLKPGDSEGAAVDRYVYINNIPNVLGQHGLIPGVIEDSVTLAEVPFQLFEAMVMGPNPKCEFITRQTIDINNNSGIDSQYVVSSQITEGFNNENPEIKLGVFDNIYIFFLGLLLVFIMYKLINK